MKKFEHGLFVFLWVFLFLFYLAFSMCYASSVLIYNTSTKEVYSLSNEDDAVMPKAGYTKVILKEDLKDIPLERSANDYLYKNKNFVKNVPKIDAQEQVKIQNEEKAQEEKLVKQEMKNQAIKALKDKGVVLKHLDVIPVEQEKPQPVK